MDKQVIKARISATIAPNIRSDVKGTVVDVVSGRLSGEVGRTPLIPEAFINHLIDYNNPHRTTAEQVGAVPFNFRQYELAQLDDRSFRLGAELFVNKDDNGFRFNVQQLKDLNTKILSVDDIASVDFNRLDAGDFICLKKERS